MSRHTVRRWLQKGWLGKNWGGRISEASFRAFLVDHANEARLNTLAPEGRNWLAEEMEFDPEGKKTSEQQGQESVRPAVAPGLPPDTILRRTGNE